MRIRHRLDHADEAAVVVIGHDEQAVRLKRRIPATQLDKEKLVVRERTTDRPGDQRSAVLEEHADLTEPPSSRTVRPITAVP
jgi:hypothetical protein